MADNSWRVLLTDFMRYSADKFLAEQKCRQESSHELPDSIGQWLQNETHVSEHRPWLNNVSTAIKRSMVNLVMRTLQDPASLDMRFFAVLSDSMEAWRAQPFFPEILEWWDHRRPLESGQLRVPTNPANNNLPFEFIEYVPLLSNGNFHSRLENLSANLESMSNILELRAPKNQPNFLQGRQPEVADRHEKFFTETMDFIHGLLAFDSGLSDSRMADIASYFSALVLDSWIQIPGAVNGSGIARARIVPNAPALSRNRALRAILVETSDRLSETWEELPANFWSSRSYDSAMEALMFNSSNNFRARNPTAHDAQAAAVMRWMEFYRIYQQALADATAGESHTRIERDDIAGHIQQGTLSDGCFVCGTDWVDMDLRFNYPIYYQPCGIGHAICMGCFKQVSLQPATLNGRRCPLCRLDIQYPLRTIRLRADLGTELEMPALTQVAM